MAKILIASPVRQAPAILVEFLSSLKTLQTADHVVDYCFIDDCEMESSNILQSFQMDTQKVSIIKPSVWTSTSSRYCGETHNWDSPSINRVASLKNELIKKTVMDDYTHLFLVDSDLVLHPQTLLTLLDADKNIISEIFWTRTSKWDEYMPQVWLMDQRAIFEPNDPKTKRRIYRTRKEEDFLEMVKQPGRYRVGGLGACTLISRAVLEAGVNFSSLYNISFWGEDRAFCIRAVAAGFELFVDTHMPAYHIYRKTDLSGVADFKENGFNFDRKESQLSLPDSLRRIAEQQKKKLRLAAFALEARIKYRSRFAKHTADKLRRINSHASPRITLSMIVKNEAQQFYFRRVLQACRSYVDAAVIVDDGSTDDTIAVCEECLAGIPLKIVRTDHSLFAQEHKLRKLQWKETVATHPEWILSLDADELFESRFAAEIRNLLMQDSQTDVYCFRRYDMWDEEHYRSDALWRGHEKAEAYLVRYLEGFEYFFSDRNHHCGRLPRNLKYLRSKESNLRLKHLGWADPTGRQEKYARYMEIDGEGKYGDVAQYNSILDENPDLVFWEDDPQ